MDLHGKNVIGGKLSARGKATFNGVNPTSGEDLTPVFHEATLGEIEQALCAAEAAFEHYRRKPAERRAEFLDRIGDEIQNLGDDLIQRAKAETALPEARL